MSAVSALRRAASAALILAPTNRRGHPAPWSTSSSKSREYASIIAVTGMKSRWASASRALASGTSAKLVPDFADFRLRSEERRVGKERNRGGWGGRHRGEGRGE